MEQNVDVMVVERERRLMCGASLTIFSTVVPSKLIYVKCYGSFGTCMYCQIFPAAMKHADPFYTTTSFKFT